MCTTDMQLFLVCDIMRSYLPIVDTFRRKKTSLFSQ